MNFPNRSGCEFVDSLCIFGILRVNDFKLVNCVFSSMLNLISDFSTWLLHYAVPSVQRHKVEVKTQPVNVLE